MRFVYHSKKIYILLSALLALASSQAVSQTMDLDSKDARVTQQLQHEVNRLRGDLALMQKEFYKNQTNQSFVKSNLPRGDISSQVEVQLSETDAQLRKMNGMLEKTQHQLTSLEKKLDASIADINSRFQQLEQQNIAADGTKPNMVRQFNTPDSDAPIDLTSKGNSDSEKAAIEDQKEPAENADEIAFKEAKKLLEQAQYDQASIKLQAFVTKFKESKFLPEAHFWQGELFNIQEKYENAAISFLKAYQSEPKGDKAGESLLQLGGVLGSLEKKSEACTTFTKAENEFPKNAELKGKLDNERQRLGC